MLRIIVKPEIEVLVACKWIDLIWLTKCLLPVSKSIWGLLAILMSKLVLLRLNWLNQGLEVQQGIISVLGPWKSSAFSINRI
jgi:hypothetical protein